MKNYILLLLVYMAQLQCSDSEEAAGPSTREILRNRSTPPAINRQRQNKTAFQEWVKAHTAKQMAQSLQLPLQTVEGAYTYYNNHPYGQFPDNSERINQLAQAYQQLLEANRRRKQSAREIPVTPRTMGTAETLASLKNSVL